MQKVNTLSSLSTRVLMVGCLLSGSFALTGEADALTLSVAGGTVPVVVKSVTIQGPNFPELTVSGDMVDKLVALRAKGIATAHRDFGAILLATPGYKVTVVGVDGKQYAPTLNLTAEATASGAGGLTLKPIK